MVKPWLEREAVGRHMYCQQDSAPYHISRKTQKWFTTPRATTSALPPNFPDCNPMDYFIWSVEKDTNRTAFNVKIVVVKEAFEALPGDIVKTACDRCWSQIDAVEGAGLSSLSESSFDYYILINLYAIFPIN